VLLAHNSQKATYCEGEILKAEKQTVGAKKEVARISPNDGEPVFLSAARRWDEPMGLEPRAKWKMLVNPRCGRCACKCFAITTIFAHLVPECGPDLPRSIQMESVAMVKAIR
jgi:hypothetical protein